MNLSHIHEVAAALFGCVGLYLCLIQISMREIRGMRWLAVCCLSASFGNVLLAVYDRLPDRSTGPVADLFFLLAGLFLWWGVLDFVQSSMERSRRRSIVLALTLPALALICYFTFQRDLIDAAQTTFVLARAEQSVLLAYTIWPRKLIRTRWPRLTMAGLFAAWAVFDAIRASNIFPSGTLNPLVQLSFSLLSGLGFLWLTMASLQRNLERRSGTDPLTGLSNRGALEQAAAREVSRAQRQGASLSLVIFDLDHFRWINDTHGRAGGDAVLREVAAFLEQSLRSVDILARLGDEEFVALLPYTVGVTACEIAERLRAQISEMRLSLRGREVSLSASFGVATFSPHDATWQEMLRRGGEAMSHAKDAGRNRVEFGRIL